MTGPWRLFFLSVILLVVAGCSAVNNSDTTSSTTTTTTSTSNTTLPSGLIRPSDLIYRGAFRLPDGPDTAHSWNYSMYANALTYYPSGDASGDADGYPGSLFGTGHSQYLYVSEINIPIPVISATKSLSDLNTATTLQNFQDVRNGLFSASEGYDQTMLRVGMEYLPKQGSQTSDKLHLCWGQHFQLDERQTSHVWCELTLSNPQTAGPWKLGNYLNYVSNYYLFEIPANWASTYTPGKLLASGRFRDGGQGSQGPSLFAYGPWNEGNPPVAGTTLAATPLLLYDAITTGTNTINGYQNSDEWTGGAWLTAGNKTAVIFIGTKGTGECWYGYDDGTVWPDDPPFPPIPPAPHDDRGWWSSTHEAEIIFYDPADLAAVASGSHPSYAPQPYATLKIDSYLYHVTGTRQKYHIYDVAFDRTNSLLYALEAAADGDKPLIHVWKIN